MEMILPFQPERYFRLLKYSFVLYAASFNKVFGLAIVLSVITFIPRLLSYAIGQDLFLGVPLLSPYRLWLVLINLVGLMIFIAMLWRMHCITRDMNEPLVEDFVVGFKKALYVLVASLIQCAMVFIVVALIYGIQRFLHHQNLLFGNSLLGMIFTFLVFLGQGLLILYVATLFIFLVPIIAVENKGIWASIKRSVYVVWNHWWRAFSVQVTPWIVYLFTLLLLRYLLKIDIHIYFLEQGAHNIWTSLLQLILFAFFVPWVAALLLVQLRDLELRKHITQEDKNAV